MEAPEKFCNGVLDCPPHGRDEVDCGIFGYAFKCEAPGNIISINDDLVCDGTVDCIAGEDEDQSLCGNNNFYCPSNDGAKVNYSLYKLKF